MFSDYVIITVCNIFVQGLTQVEEMLISAVLPIMSVYQLPHGQYTYGRHVINLAQDDQMWPPLPTFYRVFPLISMTRASHARQMMDTKPLASSGEALSAFGPLWTALMVATGCSFP